MLEVTETGGLRFNAAAGDVQPRTLPKSRRGGDRFVEVAVDRLWQIGDSCASDVWERVAREGGEGPHDLELLRAIGARIGLTREGVRRELNRALSKLRSHLDPEV